MDLAYTMNIAGVTRDLPLCPVTDELYIGAFVIFGDVELTCACAKGLLEVAPEHDVIITADSCDYWDGCQDGYNVTSAYKFYTQHTNSKHTTLQSCLVIYPK